MRKYTIPYLVAWLAVVPCVGVGQTESPGKHEASAPSGRQKITTVEGITEYQLDNGLQVLLFPDLSKPTVTVNVTYRVGSRHEGRGEAGMAHLLEHMVFKGTPTYDNIWGALEDHGASFNGSTWLDRTNYYETLPATEGNLEFALRLEADRMVNSLIRAEDLAKEMTVVRNEFEMGENSPSAVLSERMMSAAYLWHNYGKSTIGNRSDIERVPVESLRRFYRRYYQPDNATLVVAGRLETESTCKLIEQYFGALPRPERRLDDTYTDEPAQDGPRLVTLQRVGDVATVGLIYHIPAGPHPEFPAIEVLEDILTHQPGGRLYRRIVASGMATSVSGAALALAEPGVIEFTAQVASDEAPEAVLAAMVEVIEGLGQTGVTDQEVERAVTRGMKAFRLGMTDSSRIGIRLSESIAQGDWRLFFIRRDRLAQVDPAAVKQVAKKYLIESNRTAGLFRPTKEPRRALVPPRPDVQELVRGYTGRAQIAQGEVLRPDVDFIEQRVQRKTLPSGIKVALLPMETRGDSVRLALRFHFGTESTLVGKTTALQLIPRLLMRGTRKKSYEELRDEIDRLQSRIIVGGGSAGGHGGAVGGGPAGQVGASIQSDRAHVLPAVELLAEILQQPALNPDQFEMIVKRRRSQLQQGLSDPQMLGMLAIRRAISPWPPESIHYIPTMQEQLERLDRVTIEHVRELYDQFYGADQLEVAVVGDFDDAQMLETLERTFGSWKSGQPFQRIEHPHRPIKAQTIRIDTPDKEMAIVAMGTAVALRDDSPQYPPLVLASYVLGESAKSRLMNRLRHQGGLSYGAGGGFTASSQDARARLVGMAICAPQNADQAMTALREEVDRWLAEGITEEELDEARTSYELKFQSSLASDTYLLGELLSGLELDRTLHFQQKVMTRIAEITTDDIVRALREVFEGAPMVEVQAGDLHSEPAPESASEKVGPESPLSGRAARTR